MAEKANFVSVALNPVTLPLGITWSLPHGPILRANNP